MLAVNMNICRSVMLKHSCFSVCSMKSYSKKADAGATIAGLGKRKKIGKLGPVMEKKVIPAETDPTRLVSYVCGSNIFKEGEDVKLKEDSEYPDWLWNIRTGKPPPLEELDPNTKEYWKRLRKLSLRRNNQLQKLKKF